jgi:hypothetical protein
MQKKLGMTEDPYPYQTCLWQLLCCTILVSVALRIALAENEIAINIQGKTFINVENRC